MATIKNAGIYIAWEQLISISFLQQLLLFRSLQEGSYRSISLINQDAKIFTAILANRFHKFLANYIKEVQCGFIKGIQMDNLTE